MLTLYFGQLVKFVGAWCAMIGAGLMLRVAIRAGSHGGKALFAGLGIAMVFFMGTTLLNTIRIREIGRDERIRMRIRGGRRW